MHLQQQVQGEVDLHAGVKQLVPLVLTRQERVELLAQPLENEQMIDVGSSPTLAGMGQQVLQGEVLLQQVQKLEVELLWPAQVGPRQALL